MARLEEPHLQINLFPDVTLEAERVDAASGLDGMETWVGRVDGDPLSAVTFVRRGSLVQGSIRSGAGSYSVEPLGVGPDHVVRQIDGTQIGPELPALVPPALPTIAGLDTAATPGTDDGSVIDVLVVYTTAAREQAGGSDAGVQARIALGMTETNTAYRNSGIAHRVRLAGSELVGYQESGDLADDLQRLTREADGFMDQVHARRTATGADLVALVVGSTTGGSCGVAWMLQDLSTAFAPFAFSVTAYPCISPNYTFGHELAHNMGSAHAPEDPNAPPVLPYAYGYKEPTQRFRTVMAYDCPGGCPRVLHYSNPAIAYLDTPTGSPGQHDNARALNQTALTASNFRQARPLDTLVSAPRALMLDASGTSVALSWDPPVTGTPANYVIEVGSAEGLADVASLVVSGATTSTVQSQVPAGSYFIRVRAFDAYGPGPPSQSEHLLMTATGRCVAPADAPFLHPPTVDGTAVTLAWTSPKAGAPIQNYVVAAGTRPGRSDVVIAGTGSASTTVTTHAAAGVYFVRVAGVNACGVGGTSNEIALVVGPPIPGPPGEVAAAIAVDRRVVLSWQPSDAGGAPTHFVIEAGSSPGLADIARLTTAGATPALTVVAPPGRYHVRVRAMNAFGAGAPSDDIVLLVL